MLAGFFKNRKPEPCDVNLAFVSGVRAVAGARMLFHSESQGSFRIHALWSRASKTKQLPGSSPHSVTHIEDNIGNGEGNGAISGPVRLRTTIARRVTQISSGPLSLVLSANFVTDNSLLNLPIKLCLLLHAVPFGQERNLYFRVAGRDEADRAHLGNINRAAIWTQSRVCNN